MNNQKTNIILSFKAFLGLIFLFISTFTHSEVFINGKLIDEHFKEAIQLRSDGKYEESLKTLELILTYKHLTQDEIANLTLHQGYVLKDLGRLSQARDAFEASVKANPRAARAMVHLADLYRKGLGGVELDPEKMWSNLQAAVDLDDSEALLIMAECYRDGIHTKVDYQKAFRLTEQSMNAGNINAMAHMSYYYAEGIVVQQDKSKALNLMLQAHQKGDAGAAVMLGNAYFFADLITQDLRKAFEYYQIGAENGDTDGMRSLGVFYDNGIFVKTDFQQAFYWFSKAANAGSTMAMVDVGMMYAKSRGVELNLAKSLELYTKAASAGNSQAMVLLGEMYTDGVMVKQNYAKSFELFTRAAESDNPSAFLYLGYAYLNGNGVEVDYAKAISFFKRGAEQKETKNMLILSTLYQYGHGVKKNLKIAEQYLLSAIKYGEVHANVQIANWYRDGVYYSKDHAKAKTFYQKALSGEYSEAYANYALLLAISPLENIRNPQESLQFAQKAKSKSMDETVLESLAAAYAANNQFEDAVRTQKAFISYAETLNVLEVDLDVQNSYLTEYENFRARYDYY